MLVVKMAFRNIFRQKKRTILTLAAMIFGIFMTIVADGIIKGSEREIINLYIRTDIGNYKVYAKNYFADKEENNPLDYLIKDEDKIDMILKGKSYSKRLIFQGSLNYESVEYPVIVIGGEQDKENKIFKRQKDMKYGEFLNDKKGIVIGSSLAENLKIKVGDEIVLKGRTAMKSINAVDIRVAGIIKTGNSLLDENSAFIDISYAKEFADTKYINDIVIGENITKEEIGQINQFGEAVSADKETKFIKEMMKLKGNNSFFMIMLILIMAAVGIMNTTLMSMLERQREIGVLMANGMSRGTILRLFLMEGGFIGVIGSGIGFILGVVLVYVWQVYGITMSGYQNIGLQMAMPEKIYAYADIPIFLGYFVIGIVIAIGASFYSAYKATKLNPVEALKG